MLETLKGNNVKGFVIENNTIFSSLEISSTDIPESFWGYLTPALFEEIESLYRSPSKTKVPMSHIAILNPQKCQEIRESSQLNSETFVQSLQAFIAKERNLIPSQNMNLDILKRVYPALADINLGYPGVDVENTFTLTRTEKIILGREERVRLRSLDDYKYPFVASDLEFIYSLLKLNPHMKQYVTDDVLSSYKDFVLRTTQGYLEGEYSKRSKPAFYIGFWAAKRILDEFGIDNSISNKIKRKLKADVLRDVDNFEHGSNKSTGNYLEVLSGLRYVRDICNPEQKNTVFSDARDSLPERRKF